MSAPSLLRIAADAAHGGAAHAYGPARDQRAELRLPPGPGPHPVAVVIHGGSWSPPYTKVIGRPLAADLARRGWASWNIEYRRLGPSGGGWPATFLDVGAAIDALADVDAPLDLGRVVPIGHSAGGHLALWAAGRPGLPAGAPGAQPRVRASAVVAQAAVCDLERGGVLTRPGALAHRLLGGGPDDVPDRYDAANPMRMLPVGLPVLLVHGPQDTTVRVGQSRDYHRAARDAGVDCELVEPDAIHRAHVDPRSAAWRAVTDRLGTLAPPLS